ncbi:hypothetical protein V6N11_054030 [Hibiscus sabdariffa]|uniref:Pyruvate kinase n=1 Tax=Hibiscus sabdariffa TaxID=183260 RepID=A0ABR2S2M8_9ROSI
MKLSPRMERRLRVKGGIAFRSTAVFKGWLLDRKPASKGLNHFDEILQEADGIILSRGNLGIDLPPEKVFLFQKAAVYKCNMVGKPAVVTRVVDSNAIPHCQRPSPHAG